MTPTPTILNSLTWLPLRLESLPASTWTVWETTCGRYRVVFVRADSPDMPTHYVPGVRRTVERRNGTASRVWDGTAFTRDGSVRGYTPLQYAIEAVDAHYLTQCKAMPVHLNQPEHHLEGVRTSTVHVGREPGKPREARPRTPAPTPVLLTAPVFDYEPEVIQ